MTAVNIPQYARQANVTNRSVRNGRYPTADVQNEISSQVGHAARWLSKCVFSHSCPIASIPASSGDRDRWRFAWHSGPYARYLWVVFMCAPANLDGGTPSVKLTVTNGAGSTIGTAQYTHGPVPDGTDTPAYITQGRQVLQSAGAIVEIPADTDLFGVVADENGARVVAVAVFETSLESDTTNGYTAAVGNGSPIFDADRESVATMARQMWKRGAAHLGNWTVDNQSTPRTTTSTTDANLVDTSVTAVSAASPGLILDLRNRKRLGASGVGVVVKVYASKGTSDGHVFLKDAGGTTKVTVNITGTAAWYSGTGSLDATRQKYDLMFDSDGGTCSVYAVSIFQYE